MFRSSRLTAPVLSAATLTAAVLTACSAGMAADSIEDRVLALPENYRATYDTYLTTDRLGQEDQVMVLYASPETRFATGQNGGKAPEGGIVIGEIYGAAKDADGTVIESALGRRIPLELKAIVMMERRDAWAAQYPDELKLDGWEFEVFSAAGENLGRDTTACRECHAPLADSGFLFSAEHLVGAN